MADNQLIQSASKAYQTGFTDYGKEFVGSGGGSGANIGRAELSRKAERKRKIAETNARVNANMSKLKSDVDLTTFKQEEQNGIQSYLVDQRNQYAYAANEAAKIEDKSSPEYQYYVDTMNGVNNNVANLKRQLDAYKENKVDYAKTVQSGLFSSANDENSYQKAASIYGLDNPASFKILDGGNIGFDVNGEVIAYSDFEEPITKDYKAAQSLYKLTNSLYSAGQKLTSTNKQMLGMQIDQLLADPNTMKSMLYDFDGDGIDFGGIDFDPANLDATRAQMKEVLINGLSDVANQGYAEKEARRNKGNANNTGGDNKDTMPESLQWAQKNPDKTRVFNGMRWRWDEHMGVFVATDTKGIDIVDDDDNIMHIMTEEQAKTYK